MYAYLIHIPSWAWASFFLPAGAIAVIGRLSGLWERLRPKVAEAPGFRRGLPVLAADLALLAVLQQGFIQARIESDRGNIPGVILCLAFVTPLLALMARTLVLEAGIGLASRRWKNRRDPVLPGTRASDWKEN